MTKAKKKPTNHVSHLLAPTIDLWKAGERTDTDDDSIARALRQHRRCTTHPGSVYKVASLNVRCRG